MVVEGTSTANPATNNPDEVQLYQYVLDLTNPTTREHALLELSKRRELSPDLAVLLWYAPGAIAALLHELISVYPQLAPPNLTPAASNKVCNSLALLQSVASHAETRHLFLDANIPLYLYPFLNTTSKTRPFEYLRLTSLGVIGGLVKADDSLVIAFLLQTEIIPLCLRIMETGTELSKTVATFVVQKVLLDDAGLAYVCTTPDRFYAVSTVLSQMVKSLTEQPSVRLLKHIVRCYLRLSDNEKSKIALQSCLPPQLRSPEFLTLLRDDSVTRRWLQELLERVPQQAINPQYPPGMMAQQQQQQQQGGMGGMPPGMPIQQQQAPQQGGMMHPGAGMPPGMPQNLPPHMQHMQQMDMHQQQWSGRP